MPSSERAKPGRNHAAGLGARLTTTAVCVLAGLLIAATASTAGGADLRPTRADDLPGLVANQQSHNADLAKQVTSLQAEVDRLSAQRNDDPSLTAQSDEAAMAAGTMPVRGPAVRVTLIDAPLSVSPPGINPDLLVVHQQDIQQVMNALWAGGAEAMTIQNVRVISTTGVKCVGNTVVVHGTPYAPPYVITAIGNQSNLEAALDRSDAIRVYKQYVSAYQLGYDQTRVNDVTMPGYSGLAQLTYAHAMGR